MALQRERHGVVPREPDSGACSAVIPVGLLPEALNAHGSGRQGPVEQTPTMSRLLRGDLAFPSPPRHPHQTPSIFHVRVPRSRVSRFPIVRSAARTLRRPVGNGPAYHTARWSA